MDGRIPCFGTSAPLPRARRFSRNPVLFAAIRWGKDESGFILNAGEGGFCVQAAKRIVVDDPLDFRFQSVRSGAWVEARGRIAWRSEDGMVAGVELINPSPETVSEVRRWLSFGASLEELQGDWEVDKAAGASPSLVNRDLDTRQDVVSAPSLTAVSAGHAAILTISPPAEFSYDSERPRPFSRIFPVSALAALFLLILSVVVVGARLGGIGPLVRHTLKSEAPATPLLAPATTEAAVDKKLASEEPAVPASTSAAKASDPGPVRASVPAGISGFVLQIAAMNAPENANELARSLRLKEWPAFVSKRGTDRFYRVLIGPYESRESLRKAKSTLEGQHIPAIEKRWSR